MISIISENAFTQEAKIVKDYKFEDKVIIETYLQEADTPNNNKRIYEKKLLNDGMLMINDRIKNREFVSELDHPISDNPIRQTTVLYKESSHIITEWGWEGNLLKAVVETLPYTENGKIMTGLIRDRIRIGFSMRGLGDLIQKGMYKIVQSPLRIIAYDCVSKPSNHKAYITEIRQESLQQINENLNILHESSNSCKKSIIKETKNVICTDDGVCYLPNYFDMLVEQKIIQLKEKYL